MERGDQRRRIEENGPIGHRQITLFDALQILPRNPGLAYRPRTQIQQLIPIILYLVEQLGHPRLRPIFTNDGQNVPQDVRLRDGPIDVRNNDLIVPLPLIQVTSAPGGPLVRRRHAEDYLVHALPQIQRRLTPKQTLLSQC